MVIAQIATIPTRQDTAYLAALSLTYQVDRVRIILNGDWQGRENDLIRRFPPHGNITCVMPDGHEQGTDGWKFYGLTEYDPNDYILICDDDIRYPKDFAVTMLSHLTNGRVVTVMGKVMKPRPIQSFYRDELHGYKTFSDVGTPEQVEVVGTCGMAFRRGTCMDLDHTYFRSINSDIWMGIYCKERNIPAFVIPHAANWLENLMPMLPDGTPSVFVTYKNNDEHMTELINKYF